MRSILVLTVAVLASLSASTASLGATYGGFTKSAGTSITVASVNQASTSMTNATCPLTVWRCTGMPQYPLFCAISATVCEAIGPDYKITMTILSPTQTAVRIAATAASCCIQSISFGAPNSQCGFDLAVSASTVGSLTGSNPVPSNPGLFGAWNATIKLDNVVVAAGFNVQNDLYSRMTVNFFPVFDAGDLFKFTIDTDKLN
jgi:hypothetical protein